MSFTRTDQEAHTQEFRTEKKKEKMMMPHPFPGRGVLLCSSPLKTCILSENIVKYEYIMVIFNPK